MKSIHIKPSRIRESISMFPSGTATEFSKSVPMFSSVYEMPARARGLLFLPDSGGTPAHKAAGIVHDAVSVVVTQREPLPEIAQKNSHPPRSAQKLA